MTDWSDRHDPLHAGNIAESASDGGAVLQDHQTKKHDAVAVDFRSAECLRFLDQHTIFMQCTRTINSVLHV